MDSKNVKMAIWFITIFVKTVKMKPQIFQKWMYWLKYICRSNKFQLNHVLGVTIVMHSCCRSSYALDTNLAGDFFTMLHSFHTIINKLFVFLFCYIRPCTLFPSICIFGAVTNLCCLLSLLVASSFLCSSSLRSGLSINWHM